MLYQFIYLFLKIRKENKKSMRSVKAQKEIGIPRLVLLSKL
jgi:glutaredoxin-related protein